MNRSFFALFVALLIHLLFLLIFLRLAAITPAIEKTTLPEKKIRVSLKELPKTFKKENAGNKNTKSIKQPRIAPPMPKGKQLKKIITKPPVVFQPNNLQKKPILNAKPVEKNPIKKVEKTKNIQPKKPYIPLVDKTIKKVSPKKESSDLDWLTEDKSDEIRPSNNIKKSNGASAGKNIKELYGSDFGKLSAGQQKYILDNQEIMRRITQQVLNRQASVSNINGLNVNRSNVVEFYLHPNGDMTDFKFLQQSGYFILDDITKSTIEFAYSKYPRPTETTLIRYNVFYNLLRR